jgi:hypothetical protein
MTTDSKPPIARVAQWIKKQHRPAQGATITIVMLWLGTMLWNSNVGQLLRARHAIGDEAHVTVVRRGDATVITGEVKDQATYEQLSREVGPIIGANELINEARIPARDERAGDPQERIGLFTIAVDTRYDDSPRSIDLIKGLLQLPQLEQLQVRPGETLSDVILERYRFGSSDLPKSFALVATKILSLNKLASPTELHPGPLKVPILPPRAQQLSVTPAHGGFSFYGAANLTGNVVLTDMQRSVVAPHTTDRGVFLLALPITRAAYAETTAALPALPQSRESFKMTVRLADTGGSPGAALHKTLRPEDLNAIKTALTKDPQRHVTVFIIDDGWPDSAIYFQSVNELQRLSDAVRSPMGLDRIQWNTAAYVPLANNRLHSAEIRDALKEFTDLDKKNEKQVVKVIYVPLSKAQNSSVILEELLRLQWFINSTRLGIPITDKVVSDADNYVAATMRNVLGTYDDQKIYTDEAVLQALWTVADYVARRSPGHDVFFLSESWTIESRYLGALPTGTAGLAVAAVGNVSGREVNTDGGKVDYAGQCTGTKSVVAVLNVLPQTGLACNSSKLRENLLNSSFATAYDGEVAPGPNEAACLNGEHLDQCVCGTSFAAPRIAWLLALAEATRPTRVDYIGWNDSIDTKLHGLRNTTSILWNSLYLRPADLLR